jgi:Mn2+/Fe2+ NRAMP family transporter
MSQQKEEYNNSNARLAAGALAVIAFVMAPAIVLGSVVGGYLGSKASTKLAQKKYGPRDIGGVMPGAILIVASTATSAIIGGYAGHELTKSFTSSSTNQQSSIQTQNGSQAALGSVQAMLDTPIDHNGKTVQLTLPAA